MLKNEDHMTNQVLFVIGIELWWMPIAVARLQETMVRGEKEPA